MTPIRLQGFIRHKNKNILYPILTAVFLGLYYVSNVISAQSAGLLPIGEFESSIPFLPWTIWIYIGYYPLYLIWALYTIKNEELLNETAYGFMVLTIISCIIFLIVPISYPRNLFPLPLDNSISVIIFRAVRTLDNPSNCLPSLHVGICYMFAWGLLRENKKKFWFAMFSATLISISTLTTKQHYILDIITGFSLSTLIYLFFRFKTQVYIKD